MKFGFSNDIKYLAEERNIASVICETKTMVKHLFANRGRFMFRGI